MKESTISSAEMSIRTPLARVSAMRVGQVVLQRHREAVVHVHLDGDQEAVAHLEDRDAFHARPHAVRGARSDGQPGCAERDGEGVRERRLGDHVLQIDAEVHDRSVRSAAGCR